MDVATPCSQWIAYSPMRNGGVAGRSITSGMVDIADAFFAAVKQKDVAKARDYLAEDFKASTDEKALRDFLSRSAIMNFKQSNWSSRQISGGRGELVGSITTDNSRLQEPRMKPRAPEPGR